MSTTAGGGITAGRTSTAATWRRGDFNGDGKQEVAAVFNDLNDDGSGYATVQIFYHSGDGFLTKYNSVRNGGHRLGGTSISLYSKYYGLLAAAGDLDGDGKDEIIYAVPLYGNVSSANQGNAFLSVWSADDNFSPSERYLMRTGNYLQQSGAMPYYTLQFLSLAVAPLSGNLNASGMACSDVLLSLALRTVSLKSDDGNILWLYKSRLSGTSFSGFQDGVRLLREDKGFAAAPMTANFALESLLLGEPTHMVVRSRKSYASVMQTPPYHVDYITAPWSDSGSPTLTNFSYTGSGVTYEKNDMESQTKDIAFDARQFAERGERKQVLGRRGDKISHRHLRQPHVLQGRLPYLALPRDRPRTDGALRSGHQRNDLRNGGQNTVFHLHDVGRADARTG